MKKLLFAAVIAGLFTVVSCSKSSTGNYTCKCTITGGSTQSYPFNGVTQATAQSDCNALNVSGSVSCSLQ